MNTNPTSPRSALIEAHATLLDALGRWPTAERNLTACLGSYPTGHEPPSASTDEDGYPESWTATERHALHPNEAARTLTRIDQATRRIHVETLALFDHWATQRPPQGHESDANGSRVGTNANGVNRSAQARTAPTLPARRTRRLRLIIATTDIAARFDWPRTTTSSADTIHASATALRQHVTDWAWTRPTIGATGGADVIGCTHHNMTGHGYEPVFRGNLCRWCCDWRAQMGELPPAWALNARSRGERITTALIAKHGRRSA